MYKAAELEKVNSRKNIFNRVSQGLLHLGGFLELVVVLVVWIYLFQNQKILHGFTQNEIITYIIGGSIIGIFTGWLLQKLIAEDLRSERSYLLIYKPIKYLFHVLTHGWAKVLLPFLTAVGLYAILVLVFSDRLIINIDPITISIIVAMIVLSFLVEFLLAYLIRLNIFWTIESDGLYRLLMRLKKLLAGNYFPLSILPALFVNISLFLPFAYSFFVPAELYLGKISRSEAIQGLGIQIIWIIILFVAIQTAWIRIANKSGENSNLR